MENHRKRRGLDIWIIIGLFLAFALGQIYFSRQKIVASAQLDKPDAFYSEFKTDKTEYHAGDIVRMTYTRETKLPHAEYPLLLLTIDSFENFDTGELFEGATNARIVQHNGTIEQQASRKLPDWITPGNNYAFVGWSSSQTNRFHAASYYMSNRFKVVPKP